MATSISVSETFWVFLYTLTIWVSLGGKFVAAQRGELPEDEKIIFYEVVAQLGKRDLNSNLDPCDGGSWASPNITVVCNCVNNSGLHIEEINFRVQDLAGVLPPSLAGLPHLRRLDLNRNFIRGTIPQEWASTKLEYLSLSANRLSGPIPKYLGNITTLTYLSLETNQFNGSVPAELGNLVHLNHLVVSANFLTGELPMELNNLKNLTELRLSSNNFTGKLPIFASWASLQSLEIMSGGFQGPIPSNISFLTNLIELMISDLSGVASRFPPLEGMKNLTKLMLRSCNLSGNIPSYLNSLQPLSILDLSFNNLHGDIPNLSNLGKLEIMYLTGNLLSGSIPDWIKNKELKLQYDLSYNNFRESSVPSTCRDPSLNLFKSYNGRNPSELVKCLTPCQKDWYSFNVNCGGKQVKIGDTIFDEDEELAGPVKLILSNKNWGISMTGDFLYRPNRHPSDYIANNVSILRMKSSQQLYTTARLSPLSLTYFGHCLANGNYTVTLHFAEIVFRDNQSYQSLGRRMFDVYIQGEQLLEDFNIEDEAGGVDREVKKTFHKIVVRNKTLEIRFHYTGKGTTQIPTRGIYGPLISAISVKSEFKPPYNWRKVIIASSSSLLVLSFIILVMVFCWWKGHVRRKLSREEVLKGLDLQNGLFTFKQIQTATNNFSHVNKLGEGGFGSVYKGTLLDGTLIAVKQLSSKSRQGNREFVNEIGVISGLQHPNLVKLYGCCVEGNQLLLMYEYMENNNLARALYGGEECQLEMDWSTRKRICLGIAKGLVYLHEESVLKIIHRDIKTNNILLNRNLDPKISDFGLAKLDEEDNTHMTTRVAGTMGYMAPEYALWGYLTHKVDVYSFGVVTLEIVSGKNNMKYRPNEDCFCLLDWALILQKRGKLMELVDSRLGPDLDKEEAEKMIRIGLLCTSPSPALRPTMSEVVSMLEGHIRWDIQVTDMDSDIYHTELAIRADREKYYDSYIDSSSTGRTFS